MHADVNERVVVETQTVPWLATADGGGTCKPLESLEAGAGTTSLVQAPAGAVFVPPGGALGEEILVLHGTLTDARGVWTAGAYLRNPPGSDKALHSEEGCSSSVALSTLKIRRWCGSILHPCSGCPAWCRGWR
jgi:hypothetical protein